MKLRLSILWVGVAIAAWLRLAATPLAAASFELRSLDSRDHELWDATAALHLRDNLWTGPNIYDAAHLLMIPIHAAFYFGEAEWQGQIADMWLRYTLATPSEVDPVILNRLQWSYVASKFCSLAADAGKTNLIPALLPGLIETEIKNYWLPGRVPGNDRASVLYRLTNLTVSPQHIRAISDIDFYVWTAGAEMKKYRRKTGLPASPPLDEMVDIGFRVVSQEGRFLEDGGWVYQPGIWSGHSEYAYAGRTEKVVGMTPLPVPGIANDTSHAHRLSAWLQSMLDAYPASAAEHRLLLKVQTALERQFYSKIYEAPSPAFPAPRTRNFMDGLNGIYRWNAAAAEPNGYGPHELSGTFTLGWWTFLGTQRAKDSYLQLLASFPLPQPVVDTYNAYPASRTRHPLAVWPEYFSNGYAELVARLAAKLPPLSTPPPTQPSLRVRMADGPLLGEYLLEPGRALQVESSPDLATWRLEGLVAGAAHSWDGLIRPAAGENFFLRLSRPAR